MKTEASSTVNYQESDDFDIGLTFSGTVENDEVSLNTPRLVLSRVINGIEDI